MLYLPSAALIAAMNRAGGLLLRLGGNGNLNVGTLFEAYLIAISVC